MSENQNKKLNSEINHSAKIEREEVSHPEATKGNNMLRDVGAFLNPMSKHLKYTGSMAVHIYQSEMLGQIFFMGQVSTLDGTAEETASNALRNLKGDAQEYYGRQRQKKRSGF